MVNTIAEVILAVIVAVVVILAAFMFLYFFVYLFIVGPIYHKIKGDFADWQEQVYRDNFGSW